MVQELSSEKARKACDPQSLGFKTTGELQPQEGIIGQSRAVQALQFGLDIPERGFNVYVAGIPGTGRTTAVQSFLEERAKHQPAPADWCYVNNFQDPYRPKALQLPSGRGRELRRDVKAFVEQAQHDIQQAFDSDEYRDRREQVQAELEQVQQRLMEQTRDHAQQAGFFLQLTPMGMILVPVKDGKPMDQQEFLALDEATRKEFEKRREAFQGEFKDTIREIHGLEKSRKERVELLDREVALYAVNLLMEDLLEKYRELPEVVAFLQAVQEDILEHLDLFRSKPEQGGGPQMPWKEEVPLHQYEVNVVVDNGELYGAPVVIEHNPTYHDLFGRIEKEAQFGALHTDFTLIRGGSILRANGGYLVLPVEEMLRNPFVWEGLKRAVRNGQVDIEELGERLGFISTRGLQPESIPLDVKVVLIGSPMLYHLLYQWDGDFNELFKVKADFDTRMDRTQENVEQYLASICRMCNKEELKPLDRAAATKVIEHSSRLAEDQDKLSTHFAEIADLIREANFWAKKDGDSFVEAGHVQKAIEAKIYRSNLIQERIQEMIHQGTLMIDTEGEEVGRINGLAVLSLGDYAFGRPNRITASIGLGKGGIVDIEREAKLGGPTHTKGVLILSGYLMQQYAQDKPLSLSARLVFEQSYEGVEGDSASSTELYSLLSALAELPVRQGIAVTGSVNQQGEVQAIGGVNEKIEGFFEVCKARDLTGEQGVMIPQSNARNLMLKEEVVEAIEKGQFHIWPVRTIDEGIEVLTGVPAGRRDEERKFPENSVHGRVDKKLCELAECMKKAEQNGAAEDQKREDE